MKEAVLKEVETYVYFCNNTFTQFIATRTIMDLCMVSDRRPGSRVTKRWWDQDGMDVEGIWTKNREEEWMEGEEETYGTEMD